MSPKNCEINFAQIAAACALLLKEFTLAEDIRQYTDLRISKAIQDKFQIGYFPNENNLNALLSFIEEDVLVKSNLLFYKFNYLTTSQMAQTFFNYHNLIIPFKDAFGDTVALVGRTLLDTAEREKISIPKYKNTSFDKGKHLFGLYEAKQSILEKNFAVIVEGQFDCLSSQDKGLYNTVALGSSSMTFDQISLISRYTDTIYLLLDNDEAGQKGKERIKNKYGKMMQIKDINLPPGCKDIDEFLSIYQFDLLQYLMELK